MPSSKTPTWNRLYEIAAAQGGYFTNRQAAEAGYSPQLVRSHVVGGKFHHIQRGIYQLKHFPAAEHEDLIAPWLWSEQSGIYSHQTALGLHGLSDVLTSILHMTVPAAWARRRLRVPKGVELHFADLLPRERTWHGLVPVTTPARALNECAQTKWAPDLLQQATSQALQRGLVDRLELREVEFVLQPYGGLR